MVKHRLGLVLGWLLATTLAVGVASQAVGLVAERAVDIPVQVPIAAAGQSSFGPVTAPPTSTAPTTTTQPTGATTPTTNAGTTPAAPTSTTVTTMATGTTVTTLATTTTPLESGSVVATGGQVTATCTSPDTIKLLGAVPEPGWSLDVESSGPAKVRVDFESGERESEIEIVCRDGKLVADSSH